MRKLLLPLALTLLFTASAHAQQARRIFITSSVAADVGILETGFGIQYHQLTWNVSGTVSACTVELDSSADNITWSSTIIAGQTCTSNGASSVSALTVANYVRINVTAFTTTGGSVTATYLGYVSTPSGGGTIGGTISATHLTQATAANTAGDVVGSSVTTATGAVSLTAQAATTTPLSLVAATSQTANILDINNQSGGTPTAPVVVRGTGFGSFTPNHDTSLVNLQQDSTASATHGLVLTNRSAVGSGGVLSDLHMGVNNSGVSHVCGGNAVGDGGGTFGCINFTLNTGVQAVTVTAPAAASNVVPLTISDTSTSGINTDFFDIRNLAGNVISGNDTNGAPFVNTSASGLSKAFLPYGEINAALPPYNVRGDGRFSYAATVTNGSNSVTCPSTDCGFTSADVGKVCTGFTTPLYGLETIPTGCTITVFNSSTNVTISVNGNSSASGTNNGVFYYGTDQTSGTTSAFTAMHALYHCGAIRFPPGYITIKGNGTTSPYGGGVHCSASSNIDFPGEDISGLGKDATTFVLLPDFGTTVPFIDNSAAGNGPGNFHDFHVNCMGWSAYAPGSHGMMTILNDSTLSKIKISGCGQNNNAVYMGGGTGFCSVYDLYIEYSGTLEFAAQECGMYNLFLNSQMFVDNGAVLNDYNDQMGQNQSGTLVTMKGGTWNCFGGVFGSGGTTVNIRVQSGSKINLNHCNVGLNSGSAYGIFFDSGGGTVYASNFTTINGGTNGSLNNVSNNTPANFYDDGTTSFGGSITNFTGQSNSHYYYSPHNVGNVSKTAQAAAISAATLFTTSGTTALYRAHVSVECTTTSAAATVTPSILYTDTSSTVQTVTGSVATCTTLGTASNTSQDVTFRAKNATAIQYQTTIVNTPTYDISVVVEQLGVF